jgi:hypothetical protein
MKRLALLFVVGVFAGGLASCGGGGGGSSSSGSQPTTTTGVATPASVSVVTAKE